MTCPRPQHGRLVVSRMGIACAIAAAALGVACQGERPGHASDPPAATAITWREVGTWSGRIGRQTESFEVSPAAMRLRWQTKSETAPGAGRVTVTLHSAVSGRPLQTILDARGVSSATVAVAEEPRWCHFVIEAENVEYWMTLEQGYASDAVGR